MALPSSITPEKFIPIGVEWQIQLADTAHRTRVQRAPDAGSGPGTYVDVAVLPEGQSIFRDLRRLGSKWYYRFRHEADDEDVSAWTGNFCGVAVVLSDQRQVTTLSIPGAAKISSSGTINVVDAAGAASSITKTLRVGAHETVARSDTDVWFYTQQYLRPNVTGAQLETFATLVLPKGVTITVLRARMYREAVGDFAEARLFRINDDGSATDLGQVTHATTGWSTVSVTLSASQLVGDEAYSFRIRLQSTTLAADARLLWFEVDYTMPSFDKAL